MSSRIVVRIYSIYFLLFFAGAGCATPALLNYEFTPPISTSNKFIVSQGFGGQKTHQNSLNFYAVDLVMPTGEPVCAVREGRVHSLRDSGNGSVSRNERANFVRIMHADGSVADYQHLKNSSISVAIGQKIQQGECFAQVGNTGISTGPHLHFALLKNSGGGFVSIPFKFIAPDGTRYTPEYLEWVRN